MPNALKDNFMTNRTSLLILLSHITVQTFGQDINFKENHPIDIKLEKCLAIDSNMTTAGMIKCQAVAKDEWDLEMNKYYNLLMDTLASAEKAALKTAQKSWLNYRDNEMKLSGAIYFNMQGTMWHVVAAGRSCDIIRQRALELKAYYDMLTFDK